MLSFTKLISYPCLSLVVTSETLTILKVGLSVVFKDWSNDENDIKNRVEIAFKAREEKNDLIDNSRLQFRSNRCE